jgi:DNA-directed RNA polymerase specialized sigma24 family protein
MSNFWSGMIVMDPAIIDRHFNETDTLGSMFVSSPDEPPEESLVQIDTVRSVLGRLPPREADFVDLYFFQRIRQTVIASLFNVSQPTICYRLQRATERIKFLLQMPPLEEGELESAMKSVLSDPMDVAIMCGMLKTTCQSEVAKSLGVSQGLVRHRFFRTLSKLEALPSMEKYVQAFRLVASNLNIMREVYRAEWDEPIIYLVL